MVVQTNPAAIELESFLNPYVGKIQEAIQSGFDRYFLIPEEFRMEMATSKPTVIRDFIISKVKQAFEGDPTVTLQSSRKLFTITIGNRVNICFKKMDLRRRVSSILTGQSLKYRLQQKLELFPGQINLYAGYISDAGFQAIESVYLVRTQGFRNIWELSLLEGPDAASIIQMFPDSDLPVTGPKITLNPPAEKEGDAQQQA